MTRTTSSYKPPQWQRSEQRLLALIPALSLGLLTACVAPSPYGDDMLPPDASATADPNSAEATYTPQPSPSETTSEFQFPLSTCGDRSSEPNGTWYSVFVDNGNIDDIRNRYCGDAISTTREKSGTPTIQVASFASYAKALSLAKAIGGVVEQTQTAQASPSPNDTYQSAEQPNAEANSQQPDPQQPGSQQPSASQAPAQVGQTVYLNASDASAPINIRGSASTDAEVQTTGLTGDRVQIANSAQGSDGYPWYEVRLESGASGWVRGDLVTAQAPAQQAPTQQAPDSQSPALAPAQPAPYGQSPAAQAPYAQPPVAQPPYAQPNYSQNPYGQPPYAQQPQAPYGQSPYGQQPPYGQQSPYGQQPYEPPQPVQPNRMPPGNRNSVLTAREPGATINIREYASPSSRVRYFANPGDPVQVAGTAQGEDGQIWYQVRFPSGALGWVRGDLVSAN